MHTYTHMYIITVSVEEGLAPVKVEKPIWKHIISDLDVPKLCLYSGSKHTQGYLLGMTVLT